MQNIVQIQTKNWQKARNTIGGIVTETEDIRQCINTICSVRKGKIPYMPEFGTDIADAVGENSDDAIDIIASVLKREIPVQEPRCEITEVTGVKDSNGVIKMTVYFKAKMTGITDKEEIYING